MAFLMLEPIHSHSLHFDKVIVQIFKKASRKPFNSHCSYSYDCTNIKGKEIAKETDEKCCVS